MTLLFKLNIRQLRRDGTHALDFCLILPDHASQMIFWEIDRQMIFLAGEGLTKAADYSLTQLPGLPHRSTTHHEPRETVKI